MTDTPTDPVLLERDGAVAYISFNQPNRLNTLDVPSVKAFRAICTLIAEDRGVRAVVVRGAGRAFGVGGDLAGMRTDAAGTAKQLIENLHAGLLTLSRIDAPVIASLQGAVAGGSLSLALACDLAIAAEGTVFNLAYSRIGASCDGSSSWHLPRIVGLRRAMAIALLSDNIDTAQALDLGLVNKVVPAAELATETAALAHRLAQGPTHGYGRIKRLLRDSLGNDLPAQLDAEQAAFLEGTKTQDFAEGLNAFFDKRPPRFSGR